MCVQRSRPRTYNKNRYFKIKARSSATGISPADLNELDMSFQPFHQQTHTSTTHKFFPLDNSFPSNYIRTTKYSLINFLPKALLLQFKRLANIYFLITAILQCFPDISPLNPFSAVSPFVLVISLSLLREAVEDYERYKSDLETNKSSCNIICNGVPLLHQWHELQVGNLILIRNLETFPADLILLATDHPLGICYIETSSLDGEKGLKGKNALKETEIVKNTENLKEICEWEIEGPVPDSMIYQFQGTILLKRNGQRLMLNQRQFLPRGARLKNSQWIIGVVVYTGFDTKVMRNSENSKVKISKIEKKTNKYLLGILLFQLICCLTSAVGSFAWNSNTDAYYLSLNNSLSEGVQIFLTYFLLNNTMIPISLIVSLEFVKVAQSFFINNDEDLLTHRSCKVMTSSINEELGQVEYIFSDKTGTLTCNKMQFKSLIIGSYIYGSQKSLFPDSFTSRSSISNERISKKNSSILNNNENSKLAPPNMKSSLTMKRGSTPLRRKMPGLKGGIVDERSNIIYEFNDPRLRKIIRGPIGSMDMENFPLKFSDRSGEIVYEINNQKELVYEMLQMMATCHECIIEKHQDSAYIHYQGQSPDEIALVDAARHMGFKFLGNDQKVIALDILENIKEVELLHSFEFNSDRKRMSIIVKDKGILKLYMKGADSKIKERLEVKSKQPFLKTIDEKIDVLSKIGMRVLCFAMRVLSVEEYEEFLNKMKGISMFTQNRDEEIMKLAETLETNCILIGATGVEDKLQEKVPETIHDLLSAKIKFWMLTGDKLETAENVGKSCQLISSDMSIMRLSSTDLTQVIKYMDECVDIYKLCVANNRKKAFLIEGDALNIVTSSVDLKEKFIHISKNCEAVICCRVTPKQKADVVRLIKGHLNKVTLAIGDGANDVNMIQEADIGIGIYGQEGLRAVQASDFAVGEFQCLWKLLLVHGRWCYLRISEMILYFFYKNMVMTLPQFLYSFFCGFSGQTIFDDWYITLYNLIFTCFPLLVKAILDQDVYYKKTQNQKEAARVFPKSLSTFSHQTYERTFIKKYFHKLYYVGQMNRVFNLRNFLFWIFSAFFHSVFIFLACVWAFRYCALGNNGLNSDMWSLSITIFTLVVIVVNIRLGLYTKNWTLIYFFSLVYLSLAPYFAYVFVSNSIESFSVYQSVYQTFQSFIFYSIIFALPALFFVLDLFAIILWQEFSSSLSHYFRILIKTGQENDTEYYKELENNEIPGFMNKSFGKKAIKMPRASIFFEALEIKRMKDEFLKKKQFHFINIVNAKSSNAEGSAVQQYEQEEQKENNSDEGEEGVVISEDVCIKRASTLKSGDKMVIE